MNHLPKLAQLHYNFYIENEKLSKTEIFSANEIVNRFKLTTPNVVVELFGQSQLGKSKSMLLASLCIVDMDTESYVYIITSIDRITQRKEMVANINALYKYKGSERITYGVSKYDGGDIESQIFDKINNNPHCKIYVFYDEGHYGIQTDASYSNTVHNLTHHRNCRVLIVGATNLQLHLSNLPVSRITMPIPPSYWGMSHVEAKIGTEYFLDRSDVDDVDILNHTKKIWNTDELNGYCMFWRTNEKNVDKLVCDIKKHTNYDWVIATSPSSKTIDTDLYNEGLKTITKLKKVPNGIGDIIDNIWIHLQSQPKFIIVIIVDAFIAGDDFKDNKFRIIGWVESNTSLISHSQSIARIFCHLNWPLEWLNGSDTYDIPNDKESNNLTKCDIRKQTLVVAHTYLVKAQVTLNTSDISEITPELCKKLGITNIGTGLRISGTSGTKSVELSTRYEFDRFDGESIVSTLHQAGVSKDEYEEMWLRIQNFNNTGKTGRGFGTTSLIKNTSYMGEYSIQNKVPYYGTDMFIFDFNRTNPNITIAGIINGSIVEIYVKNGHTISKNSISLVNNSIYEK
jgi:hypothetical protein